ncbi:MAG: methylmalonyl-CoA mutase family protein [Leptospiraceae bacterium]|nr:methylmalonyl-CoA mutase family protein [Leptospiraceae bacterium]MCK6381664.1 methylmalonyl-CoA mutase family protein [Leptospiraceae bacterium]
MTNSNPSPKNKIRFVTAASLYDGHDVSINIIRRMLQRSGAEVIHLGHNRSVKEIVQSALQEDVQGIAVSSYQGGHVEYFKYLIDLLKENGLEHVKVFGGGGGVIIPSEIQELEKYGVTKIYSPEEGMKIGLQGMIDKMMELCDFSISEDIINTKLSPKNFREISQTISYYENHRRKNKKEKLDDTQNKKSIVIGITGTGGAGKSSLTDELVRRLSSANPNIWIGILCIDPSKKKTGGALLGDRIRMNSVYSEKIYLHSLATRGEKGGLSESLDDTLHVLKKAGFDIILVETSGIGQSDAEISSHSDFSIYVMTSDFGAPSQLEKIDMLEYASIVVINKFDRKGSKDALREVRKQYQRNLNLFHLPPEEMPVFGTVASRFNDFGVNLLYENLVLKLKEKFNFNLNFLNTELLSAKDSDSFSLIPSNRITYLSDISTTIRKYYSDLEKYKDISQKIQSYRLTSQFLKDEIIKKELENEINSLENQIPEEDREWLYNWIEKKKSYEEEYLIFKVRDKEIKQKLHFTSLSGLSIPLVSLPSYTSYPELLNYKYKENLPGSFPFTAGVFPFRKSDEAPTRMFAGEGTPERTNRRFHMLTKGQNASRLSTAFDSVTLYGEDPKVEADNFGKIGNSGVSVPTIDDAKKLYSGFDLCNPSTSVSMTINGPAPMILAFFFNAAIDLEVEKYIQKTGALDEIQNKIHNYFKIKGVTRPSYQGDLPDTHDGSGLLFLGVSSSKIIEKELYEKIKQNTLQNIRGTVQADILKEDQAQNTCVFSTDFALKMMGDIQEYFIQEKIRNFYSVSISGYHIAEAGANPISQLAFTLSNAFTYVEYYLSRGMKIDEFAQNLSFFFSNGLDPEYSVMGRVARRIWAITMKYRYNANERSQKLKYHIQTSGRSLHAQEIDFNDIRTTLQALYAIYDNTNSLHTNAYDEAITTPTEESVRRAMAIQLIINEELGLNKNHNPIQGAFIIEELTDLVEEAVLNEFEKISERGGVLGAMETMYQRGKIQDESIYYETLKHSGELKIIGVNSFLGKENTNEKTMELIRSSEEEKKQQLLELNEFQNRNKNECEKAIQSLEKTALKGGNIFQELMETVKYASLGQITSAMYKFGGKYRRSM